jgi:dynein heavy chain, axonemal
MMDKFSDVLKRYTIELQRVKEIFERDMHNPPLAKNQPPVAGAIIWCKGLFQRIKRPIIRFGSLPEMLESEAGVQVKNQYLILGKTMRNYEQTVSCRYRCRLRKLTENS